ncbi:hypothetical protein FB45DRAFT_1036324 [Roridomyces roridus]|uniref:Uncharacterized protein n=1 Tax=Roridomyces roridus TaxID=1738132 RepID=A0AAD7FDB4_9AGAR|nr:hypothetical protein FB45DRAFT_1036324 [Roridomyces roridus]
MPVATVPLLITTTFLLPSFVENDADTTLLQARHECPEDRIPAEVRERLAKGLGDKGVLRTEKRNFLLFDMATQWVQGSYGGWEVLVTILGILLGSPVRDDLRFPSSSLCSMAVATDSGGEVSAPRCSTSTAPLGRSRPPPGPRPLSSVVVPFSFDFFLPLLLSFKLKAGVINRMVALLTTGTTAWARARGSATGRDSRWEWMITGARILNRDASLWGGGHVGSPMCGVCMDSRQ